MRRGPLRPSGDRHTRYLTVPATRFGQRTHSRYLITFIMKTLFARKIFHPMRTKSLREAQSLRPVPGSRDKHEKRDKRDERVQAVPRLRRGSGSRPAGWDGVGGDSIGGMSRVTVSIPSITCCPWWMIGNWSPDSSE
jgi:hypothetical protein